MTDNSRTSPQKLNNACFPFITDCLRVDCGYRFADDEPDESTAIQKIELLGGKVTRDDKLPGRPAVGVTVFRRSKHFNGKYLHLLKSFKLLTTLNINGTEITDADLNELRELNTLSVLNLAETHITDASIGGIGQLKNLTDLWINGTDKGGEKGQRNHDEPN